MDSHVILGPNFDSYYSNDGMIHDTKKTHPIFMGVMAAELCLAVEVAHLISMAMRLAYMEILFMTMAIQFQAMERYTT